MSLLARCRFRLLPCLLISLLPVLLQGCGDPVSEATIQRSRNTPAWFDDAKLGIFIHWGLPSVPAFAAGEAFAPGELEHLLAAGKWRSELPYAEWYYAAMQNPSGATHEFHQRNYGADTPYEIFKPMFEANTRNWNPELWAEQFAAYGARYVVLVAKHHDGYTLWPSTTANPYQEDWSSARDMVGELASAVRARGMRFGVYYSTGFDWTFRLESGGDPLGDLMRSAPVSEQYANYVHAHMRELVERYRPALLWADIGYPSAGHLGQLFEYYFATVPDGTVNDRWGAVDLLARVASWPGGTWLLKTAAGWTLRDAGSELADDPKRYGYKTTEYANLPGIASFKWESTRGLGGSFGYNRNETASDMLTGAELVNYLVDTVAKNGNLLINVGPDSFGKIPGIQQKPLRELGAWLARNGEAIYGTRPWRQFSAESTTGVALRFTQTDDSVYMIALGNPGTKLAVKILDLPASTVSLLGHGEVNASWQGTQLSVDLTETGLPPDAVPVFRLAKP